MTKKLSFSFCVCVAAGTGFISLSALVPGLSDLFASEQTNSAQSPPPPAPATPSVSLQPGHNFTAGNGMEMNWVKPMNGWVGKYLVTNAEYEAVIGSNPSQFKGPRRPVESVNWDDAMDYCQKLTGRDHASGKLTAGYKYSLPTDAQYDIFVGDASLNDAVTSLNMTPRRTEDADVGTKAPNEYGLYDTRGIFGNGAWIGMTIPSRPRIRFQAPRGTDIRGKCCGAVRGSASLPTVLPSRVAAFRPPLVASVTVFASCWSPFLSRVRLQNRTWPCRRLLIAG